MKELFDLDDRDELTVKEQIELLKVLNEDDSWDDELEVLSDD